MWTIQFFVGKICMVVVGTPTCSSFAGLSRSCRFLCGCKSSWEDLQHRGTTNVDPGNHLVQLKENSLSLVVFGNVYTRICIVPQHTSSRR